ncbi:hypothetical protein [Thiolapillus sp.]|uniref:hypothetical protein n=1 Tax=Thiolapillus sp. TaxID=2017437 RepID=UPI003AF9B0E2
MPRQGYDIIFSNSLLHHLLDPSALWKTLLKYAGPGARIALMDLLRPHSKQQAQALLNTYAGNEPEIKRVFGLVIDFDTRLPIDEVAA